MRLSKFTNKTQTVKLDLDGETLTVTVLPYLVTPERERFLNSAQGEEALDALLEFFTDYVISWDMETDDGQPLELKPDVLRDALPSALMLWILDKCKEVTSPLDRTQGNRQRR
jgi:hypothetical protein